MPFVQNWGVWMKIICRPAALSALMRCHIASLIICQAMLITYNCPQAGGAFSPPSDGDPVEKHMHNICQFSFQATYRKARTGHVSKINVFRCLHPFPLGVLSTALNPLSQVAWCIFLRIGWASDPTKSSCVSLAIFQCLNLILVFSPDKT